MNLRFVEAFYWVATLKSVTRAAEKLSLTQAAVSSRITTLEEKLGVLLFDRRGHGLKISTAGLRFLDYSERLLSLQRDFRLEMRSGTRAPTTLRIGAIESVLHTWLIPLMESLRQGYASLEIELTIETTPVLLEHLRRGSLDVIFAVDPASGDGIRSVALSALEMVFVGRASRGRRLRLNDLSQRELLTFQRGSQPHAALMDLLRAAGVEPRRVHSVSSISAMVKLIDAGFGIATLPAAAVAATGLDVLRCDTRLAPIPVYASYRLDPSSAVLEPVIRTALRFAGPPPRKTR